MSTVSSLRCDRSLRSSATALAKQVDDQPWIGSSRQLPRVYVYRAGASASTDTTLASSSRVPPAAMKPRNGTKPVLYGAPEPSMVRD